jgi:hypothetical protein
MLGLVNQPLLASSLDSTADNMGITVQVRKQTVISFVIAHIMTSAQTEQRLLSTLTENLREIEKA